MGVPPVWELPTSPASHAAVEVLQGGIDGVQDMMSKMLEMMAGADGGAGSFGDGTVQIIHGNQLQEILMGTKKQGEGSEAKASESNHQQQKQKKNEKKEDDNNNVQKTKKKKKKTPPKPMYGHKPEKEETMQKKRSCWVEDKSGTHMCKSDSDCGVDGHSCKQRVCSQYGYCTDPPE